MHFLLANYSWKLNSAKYGTTCFRYLYTSEDMIKSGALLAIGIVNCGVRNECDPALALLTDYVDSKSQTLRIGATLGLGLAYNGSRREDVSELLTRTLTDAESKFPLSLISIKPYINGGWILGDSCLNLTKYLESQNSFALRETRSGALFSSLFIVMESCKGILECK